MDVSGSALQYYFSVFADYVQLHFLSPLCEYLCSGLRIVTEMAEVRKLGGSLVEISAVSTIIGAPIAEALIHGLKAACGIVWAPMSCFGVIHVVKACLAASAPDFMRESMGLRNQFVDDAIGVVLPINRFKQARSRMDLGDAGAVEVIPHRRWMGRWIFAGRPRIDRSDVHPNSRFQAEKKQGEVAQLKALDSHTKADVYRSHCMYTLDKNARLALDTVPATENGAAIAIHRFILDQGALPAAWRDWLCLSLSLTKLIEVLVLHAVHSRTLWFWTMLGWAHAFCAAVLLQVAGVGRDDATKRTRNLVAGTLPSALRSGEKGKVVLGIPANIRRHVLWRTFLAAGGVGVNLAGLLGTFTSLDGEPSTALYVWIGFQVFWLFMRSVVYYFAPGGGSTAVQQGLMTTRSWQEASSDDKEQVFTLLDELAAHQASTHPRGYFAYLFDCMSFMKLHQLLHSGNLTHTSVWPSSEEVPSSSSIKILAVTGDPVIRSAVWMQGSLLDNSELYDSCIAFAQIDPSPPPNSDATSIRPGDSAKIDEKAKVVAISCVRVFSCDCLGRDGFDRGNSHFDCGKIEWWYFIPVDNAISESDTIAETITDCKSGTTTTTTTTSEVGGGLRSLSAGSSSRRWLIAHGKKATGSLAAEFVEEAELDRRLSFGWWKISLTGVDGLKKTRDATTRQSSVGEGQPVPCQRRVRGVHDQYKLDPSKKEIRLLTLHPEDEGIILRCDLHVASLNDAPVYSALSYTWGEGNDKYWIFVNGHKFFVTLNLFQALLQIRAHNPTGPVVLWVDAICIDQSNTEERNQQVALIGDIYSSCDRALVWLGTFNQTGRKCCALVGDESDFDEKWDDYLSCFEFEDEDNPSLETATYYACSDSTAIGTTQHWAWFIRLLADGHDYVSHPLVAFELLDGRLDRKDEKIMSALGRTHLVSSDWFTRLWVVQGAVLAPSVLVLFGSASLPYDVLIKARDGFDKHPGIKGGSGEDTSLLQLRLLFNQSKASEDLDQVYALLGLASKEQEIIPDYNSSVKQVYTDFCGQYIQHTSSLLVLAFAGIRSKYPDLPSWVIDWTVVESSRPGLRTSWLSIIPLFNACGGLQQSGSVWSEDMLSISGIEFDRIRNTSETMEFYQRKTLTEWADFFLLLSENGETYPSGCSFRDAYWRTICQDSNWTPASTRRADNKDIYDLIQAVRSERELESQFPVVESDLVVAPGRGSQNAMEQANMLTTTIRAQEHKLFITDKGYIGLGSCNAKVDDQVFILPGLQIPLLLRPAGTGRHQTTGMCDSYIVVSESYVHGIMDGEVVKGSNWSIKDLVIQ
ncbi:hypothetical protein FE257_008929 [Aspergillus nanangensis]|uniref:Heterokaryon incompatibility domain-containing protein n=1 Tax=Aspergillus nanangensis TaxID=2582783 RepID=A0AAD4CY66_ASPNN|nr:hypothetical protein FE257_008929 [Aspergillus nanangensis]